MHIEYYTFAVFGTRGNVSKMTQLIYNKHNKIYEHLCRNMHLGMPFEPHFGMFLSPGPSQGRRWGPCWNGNPKNHEKPAFWTLFLRPIWNSFACFSNIFFFNIFWTSLMLDFFSQGHRKGSILKHLDTKCNISSLNMEKWKLHSRSREDTKIKLSRVCVSPWFMFFWHVLLKPVIATLHRRHHSHYP